MKTTPFAPPTRWLPTASKFSLTNGDSLCSRVWRISSTKDMAGIVPTPWVSLDTNAWCACSVGRLCEEERGRFGLQLAVSRTMQRGHRQLS